MAFPTLSQFSDFVFASERKTNLRSTLTRADPGRWRDLEYHIKPAARRAGIGEIGWHTFDHSNASIIDQEGIRMKVAQELLSKATEKTSRFQG